MSDEKKERRPVGEIVKDIIFDIKRIPEDALGWLPEWVSELEWKFIAALILFIFKRIGIIPKEAIPEDLRLTASVRIPLGLAITVIMFFVKRKLRK